MSISSSSSGSALPHPRQQKEHPFWSEEASLHTGLGTRPYQRINTLIERSPIDITYPEIRDFDGNKRYDFVFPDDFLLDLGAATQPPQKVDQSNPAHVLGDAFPGTGSKFDIFLTNLMQLCRNYNSDLHALRVILFQIRKAGSTMPPTASTPYIVRYRSSCDALWTFLCDNDPYSDVNHNKPAAQKKTPFTVLSVELVKVDNYIFSIRAGATEQNSVVEFLFSSSSHVSIPNMYSSGPISHSSASSSRA